MKSINFIYKNLLLFFIIYTVFIFNNINKITAQSFGKNKPVYSNFDFKVKQTPGFNIYYYAKNPDLINEMGINAEKWKELHQAVLLDSLPSGNPIILYNNQADFQQTNAISGSLGVGTGGVTEAFKNRIVMPFSFSNQQNDHVLGHELVHAFQYNMVLNNDSTSMRSFQNLPLWVVEGLAEYLSKGRNDPFTAMWMRDAVMNDDIPEIKDLDESEYFPYRYGQAFWAFLTAKYGDQIIKPFFMNTAIYGLNYAIDSTFHIRSKDLSKIWVNTIKEHNLNFIKYKNNNTIGKEIISDNNAGEMNVSPSISPNGRYLVFISEKDIFSTDWYLANASNGKIIKKISSKIRDAHIDDYNFLESSGTWSPDSKKFAFVAFNKGRNILVIKESETGKTLKEYSPKNVRAFTNPAWNPDGNSIVFSGLVQGQVDLFEINLKTGKVNQLTNDKFSEIQANFSPDGKNIVFATDALSINDGGNEGSLKFNIAAMNMDNKTKSNFHFFRNADNLNPVFDANGNIYFLSNRDGFRNMYEYDATTGKIYQKTEIMTGISGITEYSPAISISQKTDKILYTVYFNRTYSIFQSKAENFLNIEVSPDDVNMEAGTLPKPEDNIPDIVTSNLKIANKIAKVPDSFFIDKPYRPKFKLDYIGGATAIGVGNQTYGVSSALAGGVDLLFSDMLGNHQLYSRLAINGEIYDIGGQFVYMNRQHRLNWGAAITHLPNSLGYYENLELAIIDGYQLIKQTLNLLRIFDERLSLFVHYPFSQTLRLEGGIDGGYRSFRWDKINDYYVPGSYYYYGQDREKIPVPDTISFNQYFSLIKGYSSSINIALVGDNSYFGLTSPLAGYRYRIGVEKYFGADDYISTTIDGRYYYWLKPVSFAFRALSYSRFENEVNSVYPIYIGDLGLVRGYNSFITSNYVLDNNDFYFDQLLGSKILMGNFEIRYPLSGIRRLSAIKSKYLMTDIALFFDIGTAFDEFSHFKDGEPVLTKDINGVPEILNLKPKIAKSAGLALRFNLFGAMILEPYIAYPFEKNTKFVFGLNFMPDFNN